MEPQTISAQDFAKLCRPDMEACVLDVRSPAEWREKRLAVNCACVPVDQLDASDFARQSEGKPVYVLCKKGPRAFRAANALVEAGCENVYVVEGGIDALEHTDAEIKRGGGISLERQVRIAAGALVLTGVILGAAVSGWFYLLSAFVGAGLIFAGITDWCGMAMALAKAPWNR